MFPQPEQQLWVGAVCVIIVSQFRPSRCRMKLDPVPTVDLLTGRRKTRVTIRLGLEFLVVCLPPYMGEGGLNKSLSKLKYVSSTWLTFVVAGQPAAVFVAKRRHGVCVTCQALSRSEHVAPV